jgi:hypothetical protein
MKATVELVIVIPVGPHCQLPFILDTLSSIKHYIHSSYKIIISDDSQRADLGLQLQEHVPDIVIYKTNKNYGKKLGLYVTLSNAFKHALTHFDFEALLRLDTDALIIGHDPEIPILKFFRENPSVGLAGRHVKGQFSSDEFGNVWNNVVAREFYTAIAKGNSRFCLKHPIIYWRIRKHLYRALYNGYELGELIFGGAYAFSRIGLEKLNDNGLLPDTRFLGAELEEDHFFTMLIGSVGLGFGDLAGPDDPFGCSWKGLPASPEELNKANKKIIHSTRYWKDITEAEIRKYFKKKREPSSSSVGLTQAL